jgi:uncharacterized glyoxalase superfamily protein PhnB
MPSPGQPIPHGYHNITPHLTVRDAARAIEFYRRAFDAQEITRMPGPDGHKVMHAEIRIGDSLVMLGEESLETGSRSPKALSGTPVSLYLYVENVDEVFSTAIAAGAEKVMAVDDMFWGDRYGKLRDPFGHEWGIATHQLDLSPDEMKRAAKAFFAGE